MSKKILIVQADWNDADYVTAIYNVKDENIEKLKPILEKIKNSPNTDWSETWQEKYPNLTEEEKQIVAGWVPSGEDGMPIHSLESFRLLTVEKDEELI